MMASDSTARGSVGGGAGDSSSESTNLRHVDNVVELVGLVELVDVALLRVAGERHEGTDETTTRESMQILQHVGSDYAEFRCVMEVVTTEGRFVADVSSTYNFSEPLDIERSVLEEFAARVAVMAAYPYVREAIHQTAARLRLPAPLLGLLRQGQVELMREDGPTDPRVLPTLTRD